MLSRVVAQLPQTNQPKSLSKLELHDLRAMNNTINPTDDGHLRQRTLISNPFPRINWRMAVLRSNLPMEIQDLIQSVISKSRLMWFEKSEVTFDLVSHFQDGHQCGMSYDRLIQEFGDPSTAATLIRRSKKRNRPIMMKTMRGLGIGTGALTAAYLVVLSYFHLGKPNPHVDFLADFNGDIVNVAEEEKAWPIYRPMWTKYGFSEGGDCNFMELFVSDDRGDRTTRLIRPEDSGWPEAVATLHRYSELLENFRIGARLPSLGLTLQTDATNYNDDDFAALFPGQNRKSFSTSVFPDQPNGNEAVEKLMEGSLIGILLPHAQSFRKAARAFYVDTRLAVVENDAARVVENIETVFGLANQAAEGNCLVCGLVGFAVGSIGFDQLEEVLTTNPDFFSEEQLERLQGVVERMPIRAWVNYEGERASIKDMIQRSYTDDGNGDGRMTSDGLKLMYFASQWTSNIGDQSSLGDDLYKAARPVIAPASLFLCASRKQVTEKLDELIDQCIADTQIPFWLSKELEIDEFLKENTMRYQVLATMFPAHQQIRNAMDRTIGRQEGVLTALAIHRFKNRYGEWPTDYDQIAPEFITEFPIDQVDGSLLKFNYNDDELRVYSIGRDYDDDGGIDHADDNGHGQVKPHDRSRFIFGPPSKTYEGDWILWPQQSYQ